MWGAKPTACVVTTGVGCATMASENTKAAIGQDFFCVPDINDALQQVSGGLGREARCSRWLCRCVAC